MNAVRDTRQKVRGTVRDPEALRKAIIESALRLFGSRGYHATSVEDIVVDAGFTKGALYHHFKSKEDILREIQMDYIDDRVVNARGILEKYSSPQDRIRNLILEALIGVDQFRSHVAIFSQERRFLSEDSFESVKNKRDELEAIYVSVILQGMDEGIFTRSVHPKIASFAILGILTGAYSWYRADGRLSAAEVADQLYLMIVEGLRSRGPLMEVTT
jgi:AcrR family transcriptional regulator